MYDVSLETGMKNTASPPTLLKAAAGFRLDLPEQQVLSPRPSLAEPLCRERGKFKDAMGFLKTGFCFPLFHEFTHLVHLAML